ncbi:MAG TPA: hypothetical protein VHZ95_07675, partial [Polyangiales bacterium]|nr:hypothetical protein [Polyangiales bacterium]
MLAPFQSIARPLLVATCCGALSLFACSKSSGHPPTSAANGGRGGATPTSGDAAVPDAAVSGDAAVPSFEPVAVASYVAKVKNLLIAQAPTDDEVKRVQADPTQLKGLIGEWMKSDVYSDKLQRFFELAFQQTQIAADDFADQTYPDRIGINVTTIPQLVQNSKESFARTMVALVAQGKPLSLAVTTRQFMMTTALK